MFKKTNRTISKAARVRRIRAKVTGTASRPRLAVFRSLNHISGQLIDDVAGLTLVSAQDRTLTGKPMEKAAALGKILAETAKTKGIETVVFDRAGHKYHGRIAALAQGARDAGLRF